MSTSISSETQEEIDSKKKKMLDENENSTAQVTNDFETKLKIPKSLSALKQSTCISNSVPWVIVDLNNSARTGHSMTHVHLMVGILLDRDYTGRCRVAKSRLFSSAKSINSKVVTISY